MIMVISTIRDILVSFGGRRVCFKRAVSLPCAVGGIQDDDVIEGTSVTMTRVALFDRLVDLLSVLLFNFSKKMTKITVILR